MQINPAAAVLWCSAFILAALVIMQAGKLPQHRAHAEMATDRGNYTLMTTSSGRGGTDPYQLLYVIDSRAQVFIVYEIEHVQQFRILRRDGGSLDTLFRNARR